MLLEAILEAATPPPASLPRPKGEGEGPTAGGEDARWPPERLRGAPGGGRPLRVQLILVVTQGREF